MTGLYIERDGVLTQVEDLGEPLDLDDYDLDHTIARAALADAVKATLQKLDAEQKEKVR